MAKIDFSKMKESLSKTVDLAKEQASKIVDAAKDPKGCYVIRDMSGSGAVKVYSPVSQDVRVVLVLFNA